MEPLYHLNCLDVFGFDSNELHLAVSAKKYIFANFLGFQCIHCLWGFLACIILYIYVLDWIFMHGFLRSCLSHLIRILNCKF
jgi:hypothetical protein